MNFQSDTDLEKNLTLPGPITGHKVRVYCDRFTRQSPHNGQFQPDPRTVTKFVLFVTVSIALIFKID
jgi:hypothetical protein